jgi:osmotically inducible protein OsmC
MADIKRTADAVWTGSLRDGKGRLRSESGVLNDAPYSFATRFEDKPGTNPEELIAAAHAGCYSMALAGALARKGYKPEAIETQAVATLSPQEEGGFQITKMRLQVRGRVPDINQATFQQIAEQADQECPVSNALRGGMTIERDVTLA